MPHSGRTPQGPTQPRAPHVHATTHPLTQPQAHDDEETDNNNSAKTAVFLNLSSLVARQPLRVRDENEDVYVCNT